MHVCRMQKAQPATHRKQDTHTAIQGSKPGFKLCTECMIALCNHTPAVIHLQAARWRDGENAVEEQEGGRGCSPSGSGVGQLQRKLLHRQIQGRHTMHWQVRVLAASKQPAFEVPPSSKLACSSLVPSVCTTRRGGGGELGRQDTLFTLWVIISKCYNIALV